jgi:hypothetical protein
VFHLGARHCVLPIIDPLFEAYRNRLKKVVTAISQAGDPAEVLGEIRKLCDQYAKEIALFPTGRLLEDAESLVGRSIDHPPLMDQRFRALIAEIKSLIDLTVGRLSQH